MLRFSDIRLQSAAAFLAALFVVILQLWTAPAPALDPDSDEYLAVAYSLYTEGVFGDAGMTDKAEQSDDGKGMFFAPLYPAFLAGMIAVSEDFERSVRCVVSKEGWEEECGPFDTLVRAQALLGILAAFLVWLSAYVVTERLSTAWLAMLIALLAEAYAYFSGIIMTEILTFPLFTAACLAAVTGWKKRSPGFWLLAGACLGALALTRPGYAYLLYGALPALIVAAPMLKNLPSHRKILIPLLFLTGYGLITGPWMVRNYLTFGDFAISRGYAGFIFVQRSAFNDMRWDEWRASFVYSLPDFGDSLAASLYPPEAYERLGYANPEGFYQLGNGAFRERMIEEAGGKDELLGHLVRRDVLGNPLKHIAVTLAIVWRGMWVSKYWGLVTIPLFLMVFAVALRRGWASFIVFSLPAWYMVGFHAFTSVGVVRYNLILVPCLAIAAAVALLWVVDAGIRRFRKLQN